MNKIISFIKSIFKKKPLTLNEGNLQVEKTDVKEDFLNNIKIDNSENNEILLQIKLEQGIINENNLSSDEINKLKSLYYNQIIDLVTSINKNRLKLGKSGN